MKKHTINDIDLIMEAYDGSSGEDRVRKALHGEYEKLYQWIKDAGSVQDVVFDLLELVDSEKLFVNNGRSNRDIIVSDVTDDGDSILFYPDRVRINYSDLGKTDVSGNGAKVILSLDIVDDDDDYDDDDNHDYSDYESEYGPEDDYSSERDHDYGEEFGIDYDSYNYDYDEDSEDFNDETIHSERLARHDALRDIETEDAIESGFDENIIDMIKGKKSPEEVRKQIESLSDKEFFERVYKPILLRLTRC